MMPEIVLGSIRISTFFLVVSLSLSFLLVYLSKRVDQFSKDRKFAFDTAILLMVSGFLGGRLMHVFYEEWDYYLKDPVQIFSIWNGGFVFFGGLIASWPTAIIFCRIKKKNFFEWADFFTPIISLSYALGRIGCLFAGCCYGSTCFLPWALDGRHPTVPYMILGEVLIFSYLIFIERRSRIKALVAISEKLPNKTVKGQLFMTWVFLHSSVRFYVEYFRADFRGSFYNLPLAGHVSISQVICLSLISLSVGYFILSSERLRKLYNRPQS